MIKRAEITGMCTHFPRRMTGTRIVLLLLAGLFTFLKVAGQSKADSLHTLLAKERNDTMRLVLYGQLWSAYVEFQSDSALYFSYQQRDLAHKMNLPMEEATALDNAGYSLMVIGGFAGSLRCHIKAIALLEDAKRPMAILPRRYLAMQDSMFATRSEAYLRKDLLYNIHHDLGHTYFSIDQFDRAIEQYTIAEQGAIELGDSSLLCFACMNLGRTYHAAGNSEKALNYEQKALQLAPLSGFKKYLPNIYLHLGHILLANKNVQKAKEYFRLGESSAFEVNNQRSLSMAWLGMAEMYLHSGDTDSSLWYAQRGLSVATRSNIPKLVYSADTLLALIFKSRGGMDSAYYFLSAGSRQYQKMFSSGTRREWESIDTEEKQRKADVIAAKKAAGAKLQRYVFLTGLGFLVILLLVLLWNNRQRAKANKILREKKNELERTLEQLQATQKQLIQSEKMASLGELTAGIAHEIQNPLNFINNFSEINMELIEELKEEIKKNNHDEVLLLANDITDNEAKINHHGKRADSIVKSMLQHSRKSTGQKEPISINALVDEYLRLSYHGLRAKDKSFNAILETHFNPSAGIVNIIGQDIGRVLLNLFNNAFYTVNEKKKLLDGSFEPKVQVTTEKTANGVEIKIKDNGAGIPAKLLEKIYQPFFTTKPTGEGTGLGLSLSYDIITKGHGGEMKVNSKEGEGTEFIISLAGS